MNMNTPNFLTCVYLELFDHSGDAMAATVIVVA
jgi:hypothetical protein